MDAACCEGGKTRREANGRRGRSCAATNERVVSHFSTAIHRRIFTQYGFPSGGLRAIRIGMRVLFVSRFCNSLSDCCSDISFLPVYVRRAFPTQNRAATEFCRLVLGDMKLLTSDITFELIFLLSFLSRVFQFELKYQLK